MKPNLKPPAWINSLIDSFAPSWLAEEIQGDLYELFVKDILTDNIQSARRRYVVNGLGFLFKNFFWKRSPSQKTATMFSTHFKMARRSLAAQKGNALINILGLVTGIAATLIILTVVRFERSFDAAHSNVDDIYRVVRVSGNDMSEFRTGISYPVPVAMKAEIPALKNMAAMEYFGGANLDILNASGTTAKRFREESGCVLVEPSFFTLFDYGHGGIAWLAGNPDKALVEPFSVVLTKSAAKKYFGDENPIGQSIRFQKQHDAKVTGVIEDFPANTDFPFTVLVSYSTLTKLAGNGINEWVGVSDSHQVFIQLAPGITKEAMEAQIAKVHAAHTPKELHESRHYLLQALRDVHYDPRFGNFSGRTITRETILALQLVALFLLLTGSINYVNLSTAQSTLRAKEIGLRKVMGSNRKTLVFQFLTETFVIVLTADILALALSEALLPLLQPILNLKLNRLNFTDPGILFISLGIVVGVTLVSGFYPAWTISRFHPVRALKNSFATERLGGMSLRKVLVVFQFTLTQILVVGTFIVVSQMRFFQNVDMGFTREAIITARVPDRSAEGLKLLEDQLRAQAFVSDVSFSYTLPSGVNRNRSYSDIGPPESKEMKDYTVYEYVSIDPSYLGLYNIKLLSGRNLTLADSMQNILLNRNLSKTLNLGTPEEAVGKQLKMNGHLVTVVGIVDNYYSNSLKEGFDNIVMVAEPKSFSTVSIKLRAGEHANLPEAVQAIEQLWKKNFPDHVLSYQFFDENIKAFYAQENKYAQLFQLFSLVFLLIGCLGLYGLITFVVNRKGKEVAIRKVLGANVSQILLMFSREYVQLVALSFILAVPVAYYVVNNWLSNFAYHIPLSWWHFATPGLVVLLIALLIVSTKSARTANANPVDKLKYE
ncbi:ABC transporter permease [Chryseolinea lacunae]|uniref:ABC transporter permease n=1 Tax=Chryseolinea lacunae TaxID=2801331 RepID=A0ABS1L3U5_9BACT|nr:ABC transporter permease [Chryseolinea lacunae]MBL0745612.1 ABC transporter permease [Chryseolinea lacunae]